MRKWLMVGMGLAILALANYAIYSREQILSGGRAVLLELAPVDPRSLMQGDYMALNFAVARELRDLLNATGGADAGRFPHSGKSGLVVLRLDGNGVGRLARLDDGTPLADDELRMRYRIRRDRLWIHLGTDAFFFQEGDAERYASARYGEFRLSADGDSLLTGLRGEDFERLGESLTPGG